MSSQSKSTPVSKANRKRRAYLRKQAAIIKAKLDARYGEQRHRDAVAPKTTSVVPANGPRVHRFLERVELDSTSLNVSVADADGLPRRPTVTFAVDAATRRIVDFHIDFSDPSSPTPEQK